MSFPVTLSHLLHSAFETVLMTRPGKISDWQLWTSASMLIYHHIFIVNSEKNLLDAFICSLYKQKESFISKRHGASERLCPASSSKMLSVWQMWVSLVFDQPWWQRCDQQVAPSSLLLPHPAKTHWVLSGSEVRWGERCHVWMCHPPHLAWKNCSAQFVRVLPQSHSYLWLLC